MLEGEEGLEIVAGVGADDDVISEVVDNLASYPHRVSFADSSM